MQVNSLLLELGGYLLANTTLNITENGSSKDTIIFIVLGVFLGLLICILVPLTVACGLRWKLSSSRSPGTVTNPLYDGELIMRLANACMHSGTS